MSSTLERVDAALASPWGRWVVPLLGGALLTVWSLLRRAGLVDAERLLATPAVAFLLLGALLLAGLIRFGVWTWRRLHAPLLGCAAGALGPRDVVVYRHGVLRFGYAMWATMAVVNAVRETEWAAPPWQVAESFAYGLLLNLVIGAGIFLWGGYWWGRGMAAFFNAPRA